MYKNILTLLVGFVISNMVFAQTFQVDTLQYNGDENKYINLVVMGDGYTSTEQEDFIEDANNLINYIYAQSPWSNYKNYFNVFAIRVISAESGVKHSGTASDCNSTFPSVPVSNPNNYFGSSFDSYGLHRLVVPANTSSILNVLTANFPNYDEVLIIANSPYYGGSGGNFAVATVNEYSNEIVAHEIGHTFADLADEYYAGDVYASEKANMTQQSDPALVKWKNWVGNDTGIAINQHCCGGNSSLWFKPSTNCKMETLGNDYCSVCKEAIIEVIHGYVDPVVSYTPTSSFINSTDQFIDFKLTELMKPIPNTLNIVWELNGISVLNNVDSIVIDQSLLPYGENVLKAMVIDTSTLLRVDNHETIHFSNVTWIINKTASITQLYSSDNKINCSVYPVPATNELTISLESKNEEILSIQIVSSKGELIEELFSEKSVNGKFTYTFSVENIAADNYYVFVQVGDVKFTKLFLKH
jgi:hypothetical protein